ncbi:MAG: sigma-70 family RNA polymerase sigma factor [Prevotella sp.]|nr:sigma-70 family RNA polymerase sigma factor [Prevotella sp.]
MTNDEQILMQPVCGSSDKDFGLLINRYGPALMAFVGRIVVQQEDAEDVVQNTFVAAYEHRKDFNPEKASVATWLQRMAYREAMRHLRRQRRKVLLPIDVDEGFPDELPANTTAERLDEAMQRLAPEDLMLLQLHYFDRCSLKEIAYITGSSDNSLNREVSRLTSRLHRIRQRLRIILTRMNDE